MLNDSFFYYFNNKFLRSISFKKWLNRVAIIKHRTKRKIHCELVPEHFFSRRSGQCLLQGRECGHIQPKGWGTRSSCSAWTAMTPGVRPVDAGHLGLAGVENRATFHVGHDQCRFSKFKIYPAHLDNFDGWQKRSVLHITFSLCPFFEFGSGPRIEILPVSNKIH